MALFDSNNVGRWKLTTGALLDDTGGAGNGLTLTNNGTVGHVNGHGGGTNMAAGLNASTKWLSRADEAALDITGDITIAAWIKLASGNTSSGVITGKYGSSGNYGYMLQVYGVVDDASYLRATLSNDGTATQVTTSTAAITTGSWIHVAVVYNQTDVRLYVNGSLANTPLSRTTAIYANTAEFQIGAARGWFTSQWLRGDVDDVYLSNRALSASEIGDLYALGDDFPASGAALAAAPAGEATATGAITTQIQLAASPAGVSASTGALTTQINLAGDAAAISTAEAHFAGDSAVLEGAATAQATAEGIIDGTDLYWIGGSGSAHDTAHWSVTDGGSTCGFLPSSSTNINFTANSSAGSYTFTVDGSVTGHFYVRRITTAAPASGAMTFCIANGARLDAKSSVSFHSGMLPTASGSGAHLDLAYGDEATTLQTNGANLPWLVVCGGYFYGTPNASVTLLDDFTATAGEGGLVMRNGVFDANDFNITTNSVACNNKIYNNEFEEPVSWEYGEVILGTGLWTITAGGWTYTNPQLVTITLPANPLDSIIKLTYSLGTDVSFGSVITGFNKTFGVLEIAATGAGATIIKGTHAFSDFRITGTARTVKWQAGKTFTFADFNGSGTAGNLNTLAPATAGQAYNFVKSGGGIIDADYLSISYNNASPADTWYAGVTSTDGGNNTGWLWSGPAAALAGAAQSVSSAPSDLTTQIQLEGAPIAVCWAEGSIAAQILFAAAATAEAYGSGVLTTDMTVAGAASAVSELIGTLTSQETGMILHITPSASLTFSLGRCAFSGQVDLRNNSGTYSVSVELPNGQEYTTSNNTGAPIYVTFTTSSALTPEESAYLLALPSATSNANAVATHDDTLTLSKFIALK